MPQASVAKPIARHKTAIKRRKFSKPVQLLLDDGPNLYGTINAMNKGGEMPISSRDCVLALGRNRPVNFRLFGTVETFQVALLD